MVIRPIMGGEALLFAFFVVQKEVERDSITLVSIHYYSIIFANLFSYYSQRKVKHMQNIRFTWLIYSGFSAVKPRFLLVLVIFFPLFSSISSSGASDRSGKRGATSSGSFPLCSCHVFHPSKGSTSFCFDNQVNNNIIQESVLKMLRF